MNFDVPPPQAEVEIPVRLKPVPRWRRRLFRWVLGISLLINLSYCGQMYRRVDLGEEEFPRVKETLVFGSMREPVRVAVLGFEGPIFRQTRGVFGTLPDPVTSLLREIQAATVDPTISAILLDLNSPGGGVTASDELYNALLQFRNSSPDRRIVTMVRDMAASGGFYMALPSDLIIAQPTSVLGSVGVMVSALNMHELAERIGIRDVTLTSGDNKALLSPFRPVDAEHQEIFQTVVDQLHDRFRSLVLKHRQLNGDPDQLLDGRIFTAEEALAKGFIDDIGFGDLARARLLELLGAENAAFVRFTFQPGFGGLFGAQLPSPAAWLRQVPNVEFMFLWQP